MAQPLSRVDRGAGGQLPRRAAGSARAAGSPDRRAVRRPARSPDGRVLRGRVAGGSGGVAAWRSARRPGRGGPFDGGARGAPCAGACPAPSRRPPAPARADRRPGGGGGDHRARREWRVGHAHENDDEQQPARGDGHGSGPSARGLLDVGAGGEHPRRRSQQQPRGGAHAAGPAGLDGAAHRSEQCVPQPDRAVDHGDPAGGVRRAAASRRRPQGLLSLRTQRPSGQLQRPPPRPRDSAGAERRQAGDCGQVELPHPLPHTAEAFPDDQARHARLVRARPTEVAGIPGLRVPRGRRRHRRDRARPQVGGRAERHRHGCRDDAGAGTQRARRRLRVLEGQADRDEPHAPRRHRGVQHGRQGDLDI